MKKYMLCCLLLVLSSTMTVAQTGSISGKVLEYGIEYGVPFVHVVLLNENDSLLKGVVTDFDGNYNLRILPGTYKLQVSSAGFDTYTDTVLIKAGEVILHNVYVEEVIVLEEVVVEANAILPEVGSASSCGSIIGGAPLSRKLRGARGKRSKRRRKRRSTGNYKKMAQLKQPKHNTEDYTAVKENDFKEVQSAPLSTFSIDVDRASYANTRRFLNDNTRPPKDAVRIEELINYFDYDYPQPKGKKPFSVLTESSDCPWNPKARLVHIGLQGKEISMEDAPANNLVFLLDVSGSMESYNKLPLVKESLKLLIQNMREKDRIAIVVYAGAAGVVLPSTSGKQKNSIIAALEALSAGGSTAGGYGIELAYKIAKENYIQEGNNRIILATDGDFNVGVSSDAGLEELITAKRKDNIFLSVLGVGMGNYKDNKMEILADKGNGNYAYIDNILEAKKTLGKEMGATLYTIAKDVKLQIEFNPVFVESYRLIGYENRLLNDEDFNDDTKDAGELGAGHTVTALYEVILKKTKTTTQKPKVDPLKYQTASMTDYALSSQELMTIKLRYKMPKGIVSKLVKIPVQNGFNPLSESSNDFRFAAAVAGWGMLLRDSKHKKDLSYEQVMALAKSAKGEDADGYRAEFIRLVEASSLIGVQAKK